MTSTTKIEALQATYDRLIAHRSRSLQYLDDCPDGDPRKAQALAQLDDLARRIREAEQALDEALAPAVKPRTAYQHAQALAKAIRESEAGQAYGADHLAVLGAEAHSRLTGWETKAPAIVWEEGDYEWAITFTGNLGTKLGQLPTDVPTREAYEALRADGFYLECSNGFTLAVYRA